MELTSITLAVLVAGTGVLTRTLTPVAGVVAGLVGFAVGAGTGWPGLVALGVFFVSATAVSRAAEPHQPAWVDAKGNRRDPWQVLANGGVATAGGMVGLVLDPSVGLWIVIPSLAAASADTWATAVGSFSPTDPIHLTRMARVPKGSSGGVSLIGTAGGFLGAGLVAFLPGLTGAPPALCLAAFLIGILGMVADSLMGATVQGRFHCPACDLPSEQQVHRCGRATRHAGGVSWISNDVVNLLATLLAGLAGLFWWARCCSP